jgi:hypothetical protein
LPLSWRKLRKRCKTRWMVALNHWRCRRTSGETEIEPANMRDSVKKTGDMSDMSDICGTMWNLRCKKTWHVNINCLVGGRFACWKRASLSCHTPGGWKRSGHCAQNPRTI